MKAPISFFDSTLTGRIINRFSTDIITIDYTLPATIQQLLMWAFVLLGIVSPVTVMMMMVVMVID